MRLATFLALAVGILLFIVLLGHYGIAQVAAAVAAAGWGLVWVAAYRFVTITTDAVGWRTLFAGPARPALGALVRLRWIGESINSLLPVTQVGGDFVRAHLATRLGVSGSEAGAAAVVDLTLGLVTQILYTLIGLALLVQSGSPGAAEGRLVLTLLFGLLAAALALTAFYRVQRLAPFQKLAAAFRVLVRGRVWKSLAGDAADLDRNISTLYGRRGDVILSAGWRLATWLLHTGETWLALYFLGVPVGLAQALILERLSSAVRSAAFAVPGGLGIQEGGFVLLGGRLGLRPEIALALALVKRVREILVGAPALIAWAMAERRSLAGLLPRGAPRGARNGRP